MLKKQSFCFLQVVFPGRMDLSVAISFLLCGLSILSFLFFGEEGLYLSFYVGFQY